MILEGNFIPSLYLFRRVNSDARDDEYDEFITNMIYDVCLFVLFCLFVCFCFLFVCLLFVCLFFFGGGFLWKESKVALIQLPSNGQACRQ